MTGKKVEELAVVDQGEDPPGSLDAMQLHLRNCLVVHLQLHNFKQFLQNCVPSRFKRRKQFLLLLRSVVRYLIFSLFTVVAQQHCHPHLIHVRTVETRISVDETV